MKYRLYLLFIVFLFLWGKASSQTVLPEPNLRSVSVHPETGAVIVTWNTPDPIYGIKTHEVSRVSFPSNDYSFTQPPLASVLMPDSTYTDNPTNINTQIQTYRIRAKESNNISAITPAHYTMKVTNTDYNVCANELRVSWSFYRVVYINALGMPQANTEADKFTQQIEYEVWGYPSTLPFTVNNAVKLSTKRDYKDTDTIKNIVTGASQYYLFIKAFLPNGEEVTSYHTTAKTESRVHPSYLNIDKVVSKNGNIELTFNVDPANELDTFALFRSDLTHRPLKWFNPNNPLPATYVDTEIQLGQIYSYSLAVYQCGSIVNQSDSVNNIQLYANSTGQSVRVTWGQFTNETSAYTITRTTPEPSSVVYQSYMPNQTYIDNVKPLMETGVYTFCYIVEANQISATAYPSSAISEIKCVTLDPLMIMPNAINPVSNVINSETGMARNRFGPVTQFNANQYQFTLEIFDRQGNKLFHSSKGFNDNLEIDKQFWNGQYKNEYVKEGTYVYSLKFEFKGKQSSSQTGVVSVIYQ